MGFYKHKSLSIYFDVAGLPGGAGASAGVAAKERGNGEQASESQGGGADGPDPAGEEGAGGRRARAASTTVRNTNLWKYIHQMKKLQQ